MKNHKIKKAAAIAITSVLIGACSIPVMAQPVQQAPVVSVQYAKKTAAKRKTGLYKVGKKWKYYKNGKFKKVTGLVKRPDNGCWYYVKKGVLSKATGVVKKVGTKKYYYVKKGKLTKTTGVAKRLTDKKWVYVKNGTFTKSTGLAKRVSDNKWVYVKNGVFSKKTGVAQCLSDKRMLYVKNGVSVNYNGIAARLDDGKQVYVKDGKFTAFTGTYRDDKTGMLYDVVNGIAAQHAHTWLPVSTAIHHDAGYQTIHHDAEYEVIHHDAEYRTVHHDAETTRKWVVDKAAYDETVTKYWRTAQCSICFKEFYGEGETYYEAGCIAADLWREHSLQDHEHTIIYCLP